MYLCLIHFSEAGRIKWSQQCIECLGNLAVVGENEDYQAYTRRWMEIVNRGGLYLLDDQAFSFLNCCGKESQSHSSIQLPHKKQEWCLLSQDIDSHEEGMEVLQLWITITGFSLAASWQKRRLLQPRKYWAEETT